MSISASAVSEAPIAAPPLTVATVIKVPPKRQTVAVAAPSLVPEAR